MSLHNQHFYHSTIRKYVVAIGNIFNSIHVVRYDSDNIESFREKVPVSYGPKQKYLYRNEQNPDLNERMSIKLPRISFELVETRYDPSRKTPSNNRLNSELVVDNTKVYQFNSVPYEFLFDINIMAKNSDEALQIIEQVLPFFTPDYTMTINVLPEFNHKLDIPITINSITSEDNWDTGFEERRSIVWNITMSLKGFLYAPTRKSKIILEADWFIEGFDGNIMSSGVETTP